jgi:SARP family transcriptional regulator, regulator of embCAB operon
LGDNAMEYRILGPIEVLRSQQQVALDGSKQRTVLAALLIAGERMLPDSELSELLWGGRPPATLNAQIYTYVSRLRKLLGDDATIVRRSKGYLLRIGSCRFDLRDFDDQCRHGQAELCDGRYAESARSLRAALTLWRGPALAGVSEHLAAVERPGLEEARFTALESRIEADLALGGHARVLPELISLVRQHPLRERFRAQLMIGYYRCDRQADALALYDDGRRVLADQLGVDPGRLLRDVHQRILTADPIMHSPAVAQVYARS